MTDRGDTESVDWESEGLLVTGAVVSIHDDI